MRPERQAASFARILSLALGSLGAVGLVALAVRIVPVALTTGLDAGAYVHAARRLLDTGSPYQAFQLAGAFDPAQRNADSYLYPPIFARLLAPLADLEVGQAALLFASISFVAVVAGCLWALTSGGVAISRALLLTAGVLAFCPPLLNDVWGANVSGLLALGFLATIVTKGSVRGIAAVGLAALKVTPLTVALTAFLVDRSTRRPMLLIALLLLLPSLLIDFEAWTQLPRVLLNLAAGGYSRVSYSASPPDVARRLFGPEIYPIFRSITLALAGAMLLATLACARRRRQRAALVAAMWASFLLPATAWVGYLLTPLLLVMFLAPRVPRAHATVLVILAALVFTTPEYFGWHIGRLIGLPFLAILTTALAWELDADPVSERPIPFPDASEPPGQS